MLALQGAEPRRRAEALIEDARRIVSQHDDPNMQGAFLLMESGVNYVQAKWKAALHSLNQAEELFASRVRGGYYYLAFTRTLQLYTLWSLGEYAELAQRCRPYLQEAEQLGDLLTAANIRTISQPLACSGIPAAERDGRATSDVDFVLPAGRGAKAGVCRGAVAADAGQPYRQLR